MRRTALGGVRAARRHRPDRRRRGARRVLQARGGPSLRRPHGRRPPGRAANAVLLAGSATPRPRAPSRSPGCACRAASIAGRCPGRAARHARCPPFAPPPDADGAGRRARCGRQGDRAAQPARLVELPVCRGCGHVWMCPNCDVALVLHRAADQLACHHCGHRRRAPSRCDECGSVAVARHGSGTESVEQEFREAFGEELPVFRLDADAASGKGRLAHTLAAFEAAPAGVLVGTQMVAKGHDFDGVSLGVVLDADQTLRFPDFRAEERTSRWSRSSPDGSAAGRTPGPAECSSRRWPRRRVARVRRPPRLGRIPRGRADPAQAARLSAARLADPHRVLGPRGIGRVRGERGRPWRTGPPRRSRWRRACTP